MKIIPLLKKEINKSIILEFSDKLVQKLIEKFQKETTDDVKIIFSYINDFKKYKNSLNVEDRNIEKLTYEQLKNIVNQKRLKSKIKEYEKHFITTVNQQKKGNPNFVAPTDNDIRKTIRKFLEIQNFVNQNSKNSEFLEGLKIPKLPEDITQFSINKLQDFLEKNFEKIMTKILSYQLSKETEFNKEQINDYIDRYFNIQNDIPVDSKFVTDMKGNEFELFVDGLTKISEGPSSSKDIEKVELLYNENNLKIFAPKTKDQCILLRNSRSWCTSRDGSGNLYYNYRLNNNLTLYYIINEDLPFSNVDFASVILVQPNGKVRLADGTNSGKYSGHNTVSWDDIYKKIPKLRGLESIFKPKPLTDEEKETIEIIKRTHVGENPMESFRGDEKMVELWLEINSPTLSDGQYVNISDDLKKKYISLGFSLTPGMMRNSSPKVMKYYISKKIDLIINKKLDQLTDGDIALLKTPELTKVRESLKNRFAESFIISGEKLEIDDLSRGDIGKFISIYSDEVFSNLLELIPDSLNYLSITNKKGEKDMNINLDGLVNLKNLSFVYFENCVSEVPSNICELKKLQYLAFPNNPELTTLPECIADLPEITVVNCRGSENLEFPQSFSEKGMVFGNKMVDFKVKKRKKMV